MDTYQEKTPASRGIIAPLLTLLNLFLLTLAIVLILSSEDSTQLQTKALASGGADALSGPAQLDVTPEALQAALPEAYQLGASWGDLGPRLVAAGAIDLDRFVNLYEESGRPLTPAQKHILSKDSNDPIAIDFENARFLLNFFWAVGLVNQNPILTEGPMMQASDGNIGRFASTGGWTLGSYPATELYASTPLIILTPEQQARLQEVAANVYRPCCDNHTAFSDCNHGMAMLGLLELLASRDASTEEMFAAAKAVNGFWFPQQTLETAVFFKASLNMAYDDVDPWMAVGPEVFSGSGFRQVHQWLADNDLLAQPQGGGNSCGV